MIPDMHADEEQITPEDVAEALRKKERYRQLILSGRLVLPFKRAAQLLGPDCLFHLYSVPESGNIRARRARAPGRKRRKAPAKR